MRQQDTHARILHEALGLFSTQGYANTSVAEIAHRMGFTKAALYYHFRSKDEILLELLTPLLDDLDELLEAGADDSPEGRRGALERCLDVLVRHGAVVTVLTNDVSAMSHPAVAGRAMPALQRFRSALVGPDEHDEPAMIGVSAALSVLSGALEVVPTPDADQRRRILAAAEAALEAAGSNA